VRGHAVSTTIHHRVTTITITTTTTTIVIVIVVIVIIAEYPGVGLRTGLASVVSH
jgi:hypothetical protein